MIYKPSNTPTDIMIQPRDIIFDFGRSLGGNWSDGDAFKTDFANALSMSFPRGEKFFVDSVRHFLPQVTDPKLVADAQNFVQQEYRHRREHERFNKQICSLRGYNKNYIEAIYVNRLKKTERLPPIVRLSITVCLEHFTALFAHGVMTDSRWLNNADSDIKKFWLWHAIEETEHKGVAFDVFLAVGGSRAMLRNTMRYVVIRFLVNTLRTMRRMQREDDRPVSLKSYWGSGLRVLFGRDGLLRTQKTLFLQFFDEQFHPWQHDNRQVLRNALEDFTNSTDL